MCKVTAFMSFLLFLSPMLLSFLLRGATGFVIMLSHSPVACPFPLVLLTSSGVCLLVPHHGGDAGVDWMHGEKCPLQEVSSWSPCPH